MNVSLNVLRTIEIKGVLISGKLFSYVWKELNTVDDSYVIDEVRFMLKNSEIFE